MVSAEKTTVHVPPVPVAPVVLSLVEGRTFALDDERPQRTTRDGVNPLTEAYDAFDDWARRMSAREDEHWFAIWDRMDVLERIGLYAATIDAGCELGWFATPAGGGEPPVADVLGHPAG